MDRRVLLVAAISLLAPPRAARAAEHTPESASPDEKRRAQEAYEDAMKRFDQDDYEGALRGFQSSYAEVKSPNSHFMIARSLARLGRNVEAYKELTQVIEECESRGSRYADTEQAAYAKRDEVVPRIGLLTLSPGNAPKGTKVQVGDEALAPREIGKPIAVLPGETTIVAITPDGKRHEQKVTLRSGTSATVALDIPSEESKAAPAEPAFDELDHLKYAVEANLQYAGETVLPSDEDPRGTGPGARLFLNVVPRGIIDGLSDSVAVGVGVDWMVTRARRHVLTPVTAQWNFWFGDHVAAFIEPGADLVIGAGSVHLQPVVYIGGHYIFSRAIAITVRAGAPDAAIGLSSFF